MFSQLFVAGLTNGSLYSLVAIGLIVIYKATNVINFAQGEMLVVGAYLAIVLARYTHLPWLAIFLLASVLAGLLGMALERVAYKRIPGDAILTIVIATLGVSIAIRGFTRAIWGTVPMTFPAPPWFEGKVLNYGSVLINAQSLSLTLISALIIAGLFSYFRYTRSGQGMVATAQDPLAARLVGISPVLVSVLTWGVSAGLGGAAGVLLAPLIMVNPDMGLVVIIKAFAAAVIGGLTSLPGALFGGILLGLVESFSGFYINTALTPLMSFMILIVVLLVRPQGIFGQKTVSKF